MATKASEVLGMSDEDFSQLNSPDSAVEESTTIPIVEGVGTVTEEGGAAEPTKVAETTTETEKPDTPPEKALTIHKDGTVTEDPSVSEKPADTTTTDKPVPEVAPVKEVATPEKVAPDVIPGSTDIVPVLKEPTAEEAQSFYKQIMAPFKANGKTIELKSPEEAVTLMQMGANYTRKMQDIQPHRKVLTMLQNNGLLDEGKLSFLIDLDKKDPEAIKKFIKDSGIDPLEIDTEKPSTYVGGANQVTDLEVAFRTTLDDVSSTQEGKDTLGVINTTWDATSKEVLWQSPQIMTIIQQQRENGVYDIITAEMDRQKTLGTLNPQTPFLEAYKTIGDQMSGAKVNTEIAAVPAKVLATRVATPQKQVDNGDKAGAASLTRTSTGKGKENLNPLAMSDAEFMKLDKFNGRF